MAHDGDLIQKEWIKNKGKGPSVIDLSNKVEGLKIITRELARRLERLERIDELCNTLPKDA